MTLTVNPALYNLMVGFIGAIPLMLVIGVACLLSFRFALGDPKGRSGPPKEGEVAIEFAARWKF